MKQKWIEFQGEIDNCSPTNRFKKSSLTNRMRGNGWVKGAKKSPAYCMIPFI